MIYIEIAEIMILMDHVHQYRKIARIAKTRNFAGTENDENRKIFQNHPICSLTTLMTLTTLVTLATYDTDDIDNI